jgi:hypothetical protein
MQTAVLRTARKASGAGRVWPLRVLLAGEASAAVFLLGFRVQGLGLRVIAGAGFILHGFICLFRFDQGDRLAAE